MAYQKVFEIDGWIFEQDQDRTLLHYRIQNTYNNQFDTTDYPSPRRRGGIYWNNPNLIPQEFKTAVENYIRLTS